MPKSWAGKLCIYIYIYICACGSPRPRSSGRLTAHYIHAICYIPRWLCIPGIFIIVCGKINSACSSEKGCCSNGHFRGSAKNFTWDFTWVLSRFYLVFYPSFYLLFCAAGFAYGLELISNRTAWIAAARFAGFSSAISSPALSRLPAGTSARLAANSPTTAAASIPRSR